MRAPVREWSRRQVMAALSAGGLASRFSLLGCGAARPTPAHPHGASRLQKELLDTLELLGEHLEEPSLWMRTRQTRQVLVDSREATWSEELSVTILCSGQSGGVRRELLVVNPEPGQVLAEARSYLRHVPKRRGTKQSWRAALPPEENPADSMPALALNEHATAGYERARRHGGSRIVYRGSHIEVVDDDTLLVRESGTEHWRDRLCRHGVTLVAWTGDAVMASRRETGGRGPLCAEPLTDDELAAGAEEALAHIYARGAPSTPRAVILDPETAALFSHDCIASPLLRGSGPGRDAPVSPLLTITSEPDLPHSYGGYATDDRGDPGVALDLIAEGRLRAETFDSSGHARRDDSAMLRRAPSNVRVAGSDTPLESAVGAIESGVLLQGPVSANLAGETGMVTILCSRGKEIQGGRFTGRLFGRVLLRQPLVPLLDSTLTLAGEARTLLFRRHGVASSSTCPHWAMRVSCEGA